MLKFIESDIIKAAKLAEICAFSYKDSTEGETYSDYKVIKVLNNEPHLLSIKKNGFYGVALESNEEIIVAFRGTHTVQDWLTDINLGLFDNSSSQIKEAISFFEEIYAATLHKGKPFFLTGHSLGGGLAEIVGAKYNSPTYTFNGLGMKYMLDNYNLDVNKDYSNIKNFISKVDLVGNLLPHCSKNSSSYFYVDRPAEVIKRKDLNRLVAEIKALTGFVSTIDKLSDSLHKISRLIKEKLFPLKSVGEYAMFYDMDTVSKVKQPEEIWFLSAHKLSNFYELSENEVSNTNELLKK